MRCKASLALSGATLSAIIAGAAAGQHPASCRVYVADGMMGRGMMAQSIGSGVLVSTGIVATNSHVVANCRGSVTCVWPNGERATGRPLIKNSSWDCALVSVSPVSVAPIPIGVAPPVGTPALLSGFGKSGRAWDRWGRVRGYKNAPGCSQRAWFAISGGSRQGDSGAPVVGSDGSLLGLTWGTDGQETLAVRAGAVRYLLTQCAGGVCQPSTMYRQAPGGYSASPPGYGMVTPQPANPRRGVGGGGAPSAPPASTFSRDQLAQLERESPRAPIPPMVPIPPQGPTLAKPEVAPSVTIKTGLDDELKSVFNRDGMSVERQQLIMQVQMTRELKGLRETVEAINSKLEGGSQ